MKILLDSPHRGRNNRRANDIWVEVPFDGILAQLVGRNQPFLMLIFTCQCPHLVGLSSNVKSNQMRRRETNLYGHILRRKSESFLEAGTVWGPIFHFHGQCGLFTMDRKKQKDSSMRTRSSGQVTQIKSNFGMNPGLKKGQVQLRRKTKTLKRKCEDKQMGVN